jgi:carbon storage regulator CsrA
MLVLSRKVGERIRMTVAGEVIWLTAVAINGGKVRLGFAASDAVEVLREEVIPSRLAETVTGGEQISVAAAA